MPNGYSPRYRLGQGSPSPIHTSDSEETEQNKEQYYQIALLVIVKWRDFVAKRKRARRGLAALMGGNILPEKLCMRHHFVAIAVAECVFGRYVR